MLLLALALVVVMMGQLRQPETATRLERALTGNTASDSTRDVVSGNAAADSSGNAEFLMPRVEQAAFDGTSIAAGESDTAADSHQDQFRKLLTLAGWDAERLATLGDSEPLSDEQREELLDLLRRLKSFDAAELAEWARTDVPMPIIVDRPDEYRGELIRLAGRVQQVHRRTLPPDVAARLGLPAYLECQLAVEDAGGVATLITARIPNAWTEMGRLDEPAIASGVFVKLLPADGEQTAALFVSPDIAWHPREVRQPYVSFGQSLLGMFGMDVGLLDEIEQRRSIRATEREAFYQMLAAVGRAGANQLIRSAIGDLEEVGREWAAEAERIRALTGAAADADRKRLALASEVERRVSEGRYSVAPLFNDPASQVGQLVALEGVARRAVKIDVGKSLAAATTPSDVRRRFGIDHYFEIDLFTDDSQNNPVVFCVRELPPGFPTGESIREPVRVAGFFFKSWSFRSRRGGPAGNEELGTRQFAPLLVGRGPIWLQTPSPAESGQAGWIVGGLFVLLLAAIWATIWWFGRGGQRPHERVLPDRIPLADGQSLSDIVRAPNDAVEGSSPPALGTTGNEVRLE